MNRKLKNYDELLQEEQRLLQQIRQHEELIKVDIAGIKKGLKPVSNIMKVVQKATTREHTGPIFGFGLDFGVDFLVKKLLLARAGWITRIVIPFLIKNYSSHLINEEKRSILSKKLQDIFNKIRPKPDYKTTK